MADKKNYRTLSTELDDVLARLQNPATDIDGALELYRRGQKIAKELESYLKTAENSIKKVGRGAK